MFIAVYSLSTMQQQKKIALALIWWKNSSENVLNTSKGWELMFLAEHCALQKCVLSTYGN
jgi:hypothetical protein